MRLEPDAAGSDAGGMPGLLADKVLVIIGGTAGLGLSAARAVIAAGGRVVIVGRDTIDGQAALAQLGDSARLLSADATDPGTAPTAIAQALEAFGRFDGLYHVAGGSGRSEGDGPLDLLTDSGWDFTLRLNLTSVFYSNRAAVQQFLRQDSPGAILNCSSVLGLSPSPHFFGTHAYAAAKSAIIGLTRSAASTYAPKRIRINALAPGLVATPMSTRAQQNPEILDFIRSKQPLDGGRIGNPTDLDAAVVWLLSSGSEFVTGQVIAVDGGWTVSEGQLP